MKIGVRIKIDVSKIDKQLLFNGQKGTYLDATTFIDIDQKDQYENNGMITQDTPRNSPDKGAILGNVQVFWSDAQQQGGHNNQAPQQRQAPQAKANNFDDVPF